MQKININDIQDGEPKHNVLPDGLVERIKAFKAKLGEMDPTPLDKTIDNFRYDRNPEREVAVWEEIAGRYVEYAGTYKEPIPFEHKREIYKVLFSASCFAVDEEFLQSLKYITRDEALYLNSFFQEKRPITITRVQK